MRSIIHNFVLASAVVASAAFTINTATAETLKVPFNFTVAGKDCPAGLYSVQRDKSGSMVKLVSKDASNSFAWIARPSEPAPKNAPVVLKFAARGQNHTLQSIQYGALVTSTFDKKAMQSRANAQTAQGQ